MASQQTAFQSVLQIPSAWPAGIEFGDRDRYLASVSTDIKIEPLNHVHNIAFDIVPGPTNMNVTLPVIENLPLQSRIYFFYVSLSNPGDILTFLPVAGSGDTINGSLVSDSFTLSGTKALLMVIGVRGNYIVHAFGPGSGNVEVSIPTIEWGISPGAGADGVVADGENFPTNSKDFFYEFQDPFTNIITGMETFITNVASIPLKAVPGFLCNQTGWYSFTPFLKTLFTVGAGITPSAGVWFGNIYSYDAAGAWIDIEKRYTSYGGPVIANEFSSVISAQTFIFLTEGNYYTLSSTVDIGSGSGITDTIQEGTVVMQYWSPLFDVTPPLLPPAPLAFARAAPESVSDLHAQKPLAVRKATQLKLKSAALTATASRQSTSAVSADGKANFSLADMEQMIQRAVNARVDGSSSSSSSSSSAPAPAASSPRKRGRAVDPREAATQKWRKVAELENQSAVVARGTTKQKVAHLDKITKAYDAAEKAVEKAEKKQ